MLKDIVLPTASPASTFEARKTTPPQINRTNGKTSPAPKIKVVLADDHNIVREGLRLLLETTDDIEVVGEVENGRLAVEMVKKLRPDVVVMDLVMPALNGMEAARQIAKEAPATKVLILSSYADDDKVQKLVEEGASGYLIKQTASKDLLTGIRETKKGNAFFSPAIARRLMEKMRETFANGGVMKKKGNVLTTREAEVLQLIAEGYPNKLIAAELGISIKTVEKHRQQVMNKLNIHQVAGLTRHAIATGMIAPVGPGLPAEPA
jgi:DNA-binding NarL/FixJ family response regulator